MKFAESLTKKHEGLHMLIDCCVSFQLYARRICITGLQINAAYVQTKRKDQAQDQGRDGLSGGKSCTFSIIKYLVHSKDNMILAVRSEVEISVEPIRNALLDLFRQMYMYVIEIIPSALRTSSAGFCCRTQSSPCKCRKLALSNNLHTDGTISQPVH